MKKNLYILIILCSFSGLSFAQNRQKAIIDEINSPKHEQGNIKVMQDENVQHAVISPDDVNFDSSAPFVKSKGFKIQVFSGNNQIQSKHEAESKQAQVRNAYPQMEASVTYNAPVWRLRVGNFSTREEAEEVLRDMKKTFPSFGKEMHVVSDVVRLHAE